MKSIIFNQHQVNHALKNEEGMFRVVVKPQPQSMSLEAGAVNIHLEGFGVCGNGLYIKSPYQVGETIFVKEAWGRKATGNGIAYKIDNPNALAYQHLSVRWRLPQHMKQEHSRLTLKIKSVMVERFQYISEKEAIIETGSDSSLAIDHIKNFVKLWNSTHKKPGEKLEANPWVWCYEYEVVKKK